MPDSRSEPYRPSRTRLWVWGCIILLVCAGGYWFFTKEAKTNVARGAGMRAMAGMKVPVKAAPVELGAINVVFKAIGTVTAFNTVTVRSRVDGELQKIAFNDGEKVKEGDLLAQVDPRTYQVQLDQALGQQKQNAAQLENARRDLQRYQLLFKQNSIAKQQVDAQAALVQQYLGSKKSDQAAVDSARLQLSFTRITAPISGRLGLRNMDQGNLIAASSTEGLVVITQTQPISVIFTLPQTQLPEVLAQIHAGKVLAVELYDRNDLKKIGQGELASIDNQIDVATGTVKLKARFPNEDESLFPNQFVNVRLQVSTDQSAILIPTAAVQQGSIGPFVYVVSDDNTVHVQRVTTGTIDGAKVAVSSGLSAGQKVVTDGVDRLREGAAVEIVSANADAPAKVAAPAANAAPGSTPPAAQGSASPARSRSPH